MRSLGESVVWMWFLELGSLLALASAIWLLIDEWRIQRWPRVRGWVVHSRNRYQEKDVETYRFGKVPMFHHQADFAYKYRVNDVEHVGRAVHHAVWPWFTKERGQFRNYDDAQRRVEKYPYGSEVRVSYCPTRPEDSFLEPSRGKTGYVILCVSAFLLVASVALFGVFPGLP